MIRRFVILFAAALALVLTVLPGDAAEDAASGVAGRVSRLAGTVVAVQDALPRILEEGAEIRIGDILSTGKGSRLEVTMIDDSVLTLGERASFVVVDYIYRDQDSSAVLRLMSGAFRVATGAITRAAPDGFRVETELATIGVRGTTVWGGPLDGRFQVALLGGKEVVVETQAGRVELTRIGDGTAVLAADRPPTEPKAWGQKWLRAAAASVAFD